MTRPRGWILACAGCGLALRLAFALLYWVNQPLTHDEREYLALGRSVARGDGFTYPSDEPAPGTGQQFGRAPGYPLFLAALRVTEPHEHAPQRVQIAQALVGALGVWMIGAIAARAAGARAGVTAAAIAAIYPPLVWMPAYVLSETLYSTLALGAARTLQEVGGRRLEVGGRRLEVGGRRLEVGGRKLEAGGRRLEVGEPSMANSRGQTAALVFAGVLLGLCVLTRPATLFFLPFLAIWLWRRAGFRDAVLTLVLVAACVAPWTIRNHRVYGRWIAVASEGGVTFWTGNHPLAVGDGDLAANPPLKRAELAFRAAHPGLTPEQLEPLYYQDAFAWIRREPGAWITLLARKAYYTVLPLGPSYALHSSRYFAASVVSYLLVLPAAIVGAWTWRRARRGGGSPVPLWLMAAGTIVAGLVFFPQERFRIPVIDPALIVAAALPAGLRKYERTDRHTHV